MSNVTDFCTHHEPTYSHRVYDSDLYRFCTVPEAGYDAILFAAVGMVLTSVAPRKHYALLMLLAGVALGVLNIKLNMHEFSNSISLWMGLSPAETFFYVFLPPLLLDSAVRIDFFTFKKVYVKILVFAFLVVAANTVILAAFMLYGLRLKDTWSWTDAFLFATMVASTDAVAVTAIMKEGGSPEELGTLIEGESLFNDATSIVFFNLFWPRFKQSLEGTLEDAPVGQIVGEMSISVLYLAVGGIAMGLLCGFITSWILKYLQSRKRHVPVVEVGVITGVSYLCFYIANGPARVSGVIAVVVYGLYGSATTLWDMSPQARESKIFESFWDVMSLLINGVVFLYAGVLATEFSWRMAETLYEESHLSIWMVFCYLPLIYAAVFIFRFLEIALFSPLLWLMGAKLKWSEMTFISMAGLRGALALILAQTLLQYQFPAREGIQAKEKVRAQLALWTCGFTMLTLLINAPLIPWLLRVTGLDRISDFRKELREKARDALMTYTEQLIIQFKDKGDETMRSVDWNLVESFAGLKTQEKENDTQIEKREGKTLKRRKTRAIIRKTRWNLLDTLMKPLMMDNNEDAPFDEEMGSTAEEKVKAMNRTLARMGDHSNELPFAASMEYMETLIEPSKDHKSQGSSLEGPFGQSALVGPGKRTNTRKYTAQVVALTNMRQGKGNEERSTILIEQESITRALKMQSADVSQGGSRYTAPPSQMSFTGLRRREESSLPDAWHNEESTALLSKRSPADTSTVPKHVVRKLSIEQNAVSGRSDGAWAGFLNAEDLSSDSDSSYTVSDESDETMEEARVRLLSGLKRHFHERHTAGLISGQGLRILSATCNRCMEHGYLALNVWDEVQKEISGKYSLQFLAMLTYRMRKIGFTVRSWPAVLRGPILFILMPIASRLVWHLTCSMQLALEVAMEVWLGLLAYRNHSSLLDSKRSTTLAAEVQNQAELVWTFIINREIEAPDRFQAIQTIRAAKAVLRQKKTHVEDLTARGLLEEGERDSILEDILERLRIVINHNFNLQPSGLEDVVKNNPMFSGISREVFMKVVASCQLRVFEHGEDVVQKNDRRVDGDGGIHIVINGLLRTGVTDLDGETNDFYVGRGGVLGLLSGLTGTKFPRVGQAFAELNALGHGPTILTIPGDSIQHIHLMASDGNLEYQQLELNMFRLAAVHVVEYILDEMMDIHIGISLKAAVSNRSGSREPAHLERERPDETEHDNLVEATEISIVHIKNGLLNGKLIFLAPGEEYSQTSVFVLMHGTLRTEKAQPLMPAETTNSTLPEGESGDTETLEIAAPCIFTWIMDPQVHAEPFNFTAGSDGAMLVAAFTDRKSFAKPDKTRDREQSRIPPPVPRTVPRFNGELRKSLPTSMRNIYAVGTT